LYFEELNKTVTDILPDECNCQKTDVKDIISVVNDVIAITGKERDKVIPILQEVQKRLNYLPSEALKYICKVTEITPGQYPEFLHFIHSSPYSFRKAYCKNMSWNSLSCERRTTCIRCI